MGRSTIFNRPLKMSSTTSPGWSVHRFQLFPIQIRISASRHSHCCSSSILTFNSKSFVSCSLPTPFRDSVRNDLCVLKRRALVFSSPMPFLLPLYLGSLAVATAETGTSADLRIREEVRKVVSKGKAAGILRLVFHDAGTFCVDENSGGMNGSIVYELDRPENTGLKKSLKILEKAKIEVDAVEPASWADMIAVAGAEAVSICGGPNIPVGLGRLDSLKDDPEGRLPLESLDALGLKQYFLKKGFSTRELVALSGAHTLGSKGFGNPTVFDNSYFRILLEKPWKSSAGGMTSMIGLPSDRALAEDGECMRWIEKYAQNQKTFFEDFKNAYTKLVNSGAVWKRAQSRQPSKF